MRKAPQMSPSDIHNPQDILLFLYDSIVVRLDDDEGLTELIHLIVLEVFFLTYIWNVKIWFDERKKNKR